MKDIFEYSNFGIEFNENSVANEEATEQEINSLAGSFDFNNLFLIDKSKNYALDILTTYRKVSATGNKSVSDYIAKFETERVLSETFFNSFVKAKSGLPSEQVAVLTKQIRYLSNLKKLTDNA